MKKIVLASGNAGKIREIREIFSGLDVEIVAQSGLGIESPEESGETFTENALIKARYAAEQTGLATIADDSGIAVEALGGKPGVHSARYAGANAGDEDNLLRLLRELEGVPDEDRSAAFHCAAVLVFPGDTEASIVVEEVWHGTILHSRRGAGGFGYDPVFLDPDSHKTGAEMSKAEKNAVSHRGKAFRKLRQRIGALCERRR